MPRCAWCHQPVGDLRAITLQNGRERHTVSVHPEHEQPVVDWHRAFVKRQGEFVLRLSLLPLLLLGAIGLASLISKRLVLPAVGLAVVWAAVTVWQLPFATPQTVSLIGLRRSIALCRTLAAATGLIGIILVAALLWLPSHVA